MGDGGQRGQGSPQRPSPCSCLSDCPGARAARLFLYHLCSAPHFLQNHLLARENYSPLSGSNSCAELPASPRPLSRLPGIADCTLTTKATVLAPHVHPDLDLATPDLFLSAFLGGAWETVAEVLGKGGTGRGPEVGWPGQSWLGEGLSWRTCLHGQGLRGRQALCECVIGSVSVRACVCLFRVPE